MSESIDPSRDTARVPDEPRASDERSGGQASTAPISDARVDELVDTVDEQGTSDADPATRRPGPLEDDAEVTTGMPARTSVLGMGS